MPAVGIEPTLDDKSNGILSPARLPVPPCRRKEMTGKWTHGAGVLTLVQLFYQRVTLYSGFHFDATTVI